MRSGRFTGKFVIWGIILISLLIAAILAVAISGLYLNHNAHIIISILHLLFFSLLGYFLAKTVLGFTRKKELEHELTKMNETLEQKVKDRTNELLVSKQTLAGMLERISEGFIAFDKDWRYTYVNKKAATLLNRKAEDIIGKCIWDIFPQTVGKPMYNTYMKAIDTQQYTYSEEYSYTLNCWLESHIYPSSDGLSVYFRDITASKKIEARLKSDEEKIIKLNRLYHFISEINQMIVRTSDENALFEKACRIAVEHGKFAMAWIGLLEEDTHKIIPLVHASNIPGKSFENIRQIVNDSENAKVCIAHRALRENMPITCNDIEAELGISPWKEVIVKEGYYSTVSLPIRKRGNTIGVFSFFASVKDFFDSDEIALIGEAAEDIGFALENLDRVRQHKKAEEDLAKSERRYHVLAEMAPVGIFHTDKEGNSTYVNPKWTEITGLTLYDAYGFKWVNSVHEDDRVDLMQNWKVLTTLQQSSLAEYRFIRPDGSESWVIGQAIPERDEKGVLQGYVGTITDITEIRQAQEEIAFERDLSDTIINSLPEVFFIFSIDGKFLRWNKNVELITGYTTDEVSKMHPLDFFTDEHKSLIKEATEDLFTSTREATLANIITRNGQVIPFYFFGVIIDYKGQKALMGVGVDFSDKLRDQEKIKQASEELRRLAIHLQNVREEERKMIGREMHDELGQQLTAIKMGISWIDKRIPDTSVELKNKIKNLTTLLDNGNLFVRRILNELRPVALYDNGLPEALKWQGEQFAVNTGIPIVFNNLDTGLKVKDEVAVCVYRVFQEALTNISRHAKAQNVWVTVKKEEEYVILDIIDDGVGFDYQEKAKKRSFGILGMKERVLSLNGNFDMESFPGKGTRVKVSIPNVN